MISTKARYALRVLIDLAQNQEDSYVPLKELSKRQEISEKYLEIILKILVKGKIVKGLRGKGGGDDPPGEGGEQAHAEAGGGLLPPSGLQSALQLL